MKQLLITIAAVLLMGCGPSISIHKAAKAGNIDVVKKYLAAGTDVDTKDDNGATPLFYAANSDHKEVAELLIAKGADVNAMRRQNASTPLHYATANNHKEIAALLIAKGADMNAKDDNGTTSLHFAAEWDHREIVELLIAKGADVNAKNNVGQTPLNLAIDEKHPQIADLLRKHGGKTGEELKAEGK